MKTRTELRDFLRGGRIQVQAKNKRGFASVPPEKMRENASKGGKAAHAQGKAHEFTSEEAREAGRRGGKAAHAQGAAHEFTSEEAREAGRKGGAAVSQDRAHMTAIGRLGGKKRARNRKAAE